MEQDRIRRPQQLMITEQETRRRRRTRIFLHV